MPQPELNPVDGLAQLAFLVMGMLERRAAELDLSIPATRLLGVLRDREPTMQELARLLDLRPGSVVPLGTKGADDGELNVAGQRVAFGSCGVRNGRAAFQVRSAIF